MLHKCAREARAQSRCFRASVPPPADRAALPRWLLGLAFPGAAELGDQAPVRVLHERAGDLTQTSRSAHFLSHHRTLVSDVGSGRDRCLHLDSPYRKGDAMSPAAAAVGHYGLGHRESCGSPRSGVDAGGLVGISLRKTAGELGTAQGAHNATEQKFERAPLKRVAPLRLCGTGAGTPTPLAARRPVPLASCSRRRARSPPAMVPPC